MIKSICYFREALIILFMITTLLFVEIRWTVYDMFIFLGISIFFILGGVIQIGLKREIRITAVDLVAIAWFAYYVNRVWIGNEWPCRMEFLKTIGLFLLYFMFRTVFDGTKLSSKFIIVCILVGSSFESLLGVGQLCVSIVEHTPFHSFGTFLNPGPYSAYLMLGIVVGLASINDFEGKGKKCILISLLIMEMVISSTFSRAAFVGLLIVFLFLYKNKYWRYRYVLWSVIAIACVATYFIKQGSADGRIVIWNISLASWLEYPWLGVGIGGFFHTFAEGMVKMADNGLKIYSANVPDSTYNIVVKILLEQGIVGLLMSLITCFLVLKGLYKNCTPFFYGILSMLVFALFSYPFELLPYKIIMVLIVAWNESASGKKVIELGNVKLFLTTCFLSFGSWQSGLLVGSCYKADNLFNDNQNNTAEEIKDKGYKILSYEYDNANFLFDFGKALRAMGRYQDSNAIFKQGTKCSADPMFYVLMGNNYKDMKWYDMAEQSYQKAFDIMPNRLYPHYQLMLLFKDTGDKQKFFEMAKRVVNMKPKIESSATIDMKNEAMMLLRGE